MIEQSHITFYTNHQITISTENHDNTSGKIRSARKVAFLINPSLSSDYHDHNHWMIAYLVYQRQYSPFFSRYNMQGM